MVIAGTASSVLSQAVVNNPCEGIDYREAGRAAAFGALGGLAAGTGEAVGGLVVDVGSDVVGAGASSYRNFGGVVGGVVGTAIGTQ